MSNRSDAPHKILPSADPAWLASWAEEILDPALPIVDAHHHLWGEPRGPYLEEHYARDLASGHNVVATIYVDCTEAYRTSGPVSFRSVGETEFAAAIGRHNDLVRSGGPKMCLGIVGRVDLETGAAVRDVLEAHIVAGQGRFKGVRYSTAWDPHPGVRSTMRTPPARLLYDPGVREGAACVASLGLVLDTWVYHHQLPDIADFADALPNAPLVLDHVGGPVRVGPYKDRTDAVYDQWLNGIKAVAQRQNVVVKVGGLGMHLLGFGFESRQRAPSSEDLAAAWCPFVEPCIDLFGPDRVMFESNFPVDSLSGSYPVVWNACKRLVSGCSAPEKAAMFHENAARIYSLNLNH